MRSDDIAVSRQGNLVVINHSKFEIKFTSQKEPGITLTNMATLLSETVVQKLRLATAASSKLKTLAPANLSHNRRRMFLAIVSRSVSRMRQRIKVSE